MEQRIPQGKVIEEKSIPYAEWLDPKDSGGGCGGGSGGGDNQPKDNGQSQSQSSQGSQRDNP